MTNVGIIGCGNIARFHCEGYERAGARIVHVCDLRAEAAQALAHRYGARASPDYRAVLDDPQVQLVSVLTTAATHKEICLAAIEAGKGVVCEKTLTDSAEASYEVALAAERADIFFATAYMKRFFPALQLTKKLLAEMGQIISVYARSWQPWDLWTTPLPPELTTHPSPMMAKYSGGALVCCGSHILDLIHWLAGRPERLCGDLYIREGMDADIQANAMIWLEGGGIVHFETCWHPLRFAGYERNGWDERLEINTVAGRLDVYTVKWDQPLNNPALVVHHEAATGRTTEYRFPAVNPFDVEMAEMVRRFEAGEPGFPSAWDGYVVDETIAHIAQSACEKTVMQVRWRDRAS